MQLYYPLLTFAPGEPFAIENPYDDRAEGPLLVTHSEGVNLILYSDQANADRVLFETRTLVVGLAQFDDVPFLALTFPDHDLTLLYSFSLFKMIGDERAVWLRSAGLQLGVHLVDNATGLLVASRTAETQIVRRLKQYARDQWRAYPNAESVDIALHRLLNPPAHEAHTQVTPERVMLRAELMHEVVIQTVNVNPQNNQ